MPPVTPNLTATNKWISDQVFLEPGYLPYLSFSSFLSGVWSEVSLRALALRQSMARLSPTLPTTSSIPSLSRATVAVEPALTTTTPGSRGKHVRGGNTSEDHTHTHNCKARHIQLTINTQSWQSYYGKLVSQNTQWIIQIHAQNVFSHIHSIGGTWQTLTSHTPQHENRMEGEVTSLNKKDGWRERVRQTCMSHCFRVTETEWEQLQYGQWNFGSLTSGVIQKCQSYNEWPNIQSYIQCTGPWQNTESSSDRRASFRIR